MPTLVVPEGFSYVLGSAVATVYLHAWQMTRVGAARKAAGVAYPQLYAEKSEAAVSKAAYRFNCVQRAHQNTLENLPSVVMSLFIAGLKFPVVASALGGGWVLGRILYTIGYSTGDPSKRNSRGGIIGSISQLGLLGTATYAAYCFITEGL